MANLQIVKLTPEEWQQYKQIRLESLRDEPQAFATAYTDALQMPDTYWQDRLRQVQQGQKSWLLFAKEDDQLIGMIGAFRLEDGNTVEIVSVFVSREKRGHGAGAALMAAILDEVSKTHSFQKAVLGVNAEQIAAMALYQRFGFRITGEKTGVAGDGKEHKGYLMEKPLNQEP